MSAADPTPPAAYPGPARLPALTPALAVGDARWSAAAGAAVARRLAGQLVAQGLGAGAVVLRAADQPLHLLFLQHALLRVGAGLLPFPAELPAAQVDELAAAVAAEWRWGAGRLLRTGHRRPAQRGQQQQAAPPLLIRTSGSGGLPKVVMLSAAQLWASAARATAALDLCAGDEWLCVLPLHHIGGLAIGWRCALAGASMRLVAAGSTPGAGAGAAEGQTSPCLCGDGTEYVAPGSGFDARATAATLASHRVTHLSLVPTMLARLLEVLPSPPPSLRVVLVGGQALQPTLAQRAVRAGWPLYVSYGMSETGSMVAVGRWQDDRALDNRIGTPLPGVQLDCAGPDEPPRALRLRGPMLMAGYADVSRRLGSGLADGWLATNDLCRLDADGALRVFGRADDLIVIGGEQVSPAMVEARLSQAPGVQEVAVVPLAHPHWGATLAACWLGPATAAELAAWCRAELPSRERPRLFRPLAALPLLASGKPDRQALIRLVVADVAGEAPATGAR